TLLATRTAEPPTAAVAASPATPAQNAGAERSLLKSQALLDGWEAASPVDEIALAMPASAAAPAHAFEGRLELVGEKEGAHMQVVRGELGPEYAKLPEFDFE